jgi:hypothetical protein
MGVHNKPKKVTIETVLKAVVTLNLALLDMIVAYRQPLPTGSSQHNPIS